MTTGHCESSLGSFDELQNIAQAAVDPQTKPPGLGCESACRQLSSTTIIAIYYYYSARKADTHLPSHVACDVLLIVMYIPTRPLTLTRYPC